MAQPLPPGSPSPPGPPGLIGSFIDTTTGPLPRKAVLLVAPVTIFYGLAIISIGLRIWGKMIKKNTIRFNDYAIFIAAIFATGYLSICWLGE